MSWWPGFMPFVEAICAILCGDLQRFKANMHLAAGTARLYHWSPTAAAYRASVRTVGSVLDHFEARQCFTAHAHSAATCRSSCTGKTVSGTESRIRFLTQFLHRRYFHLFCRGRVALHHVNFRAAGASGRRGIPGSARESGPPDGRAKFHPLVPEPGWPAMASSKNTQNCLNSLEFPEHCGAAWVDRIEQWGRAVGAGTLVFTMI